VQVIDDKELFNRCKEKEVECKEKALCDDRDGKEIHKLFRNVPEKEVMQMVFAIELERYRYEFECAESVEAPRSPDIYSSDKVSSHTN
jgi:hypothetical protein